MIKKNFKNLAVCAVTMIPFALLVIFTVILLSGCGKTDIDTTEKITETLQEESKAENDSVIHKPAVESGEIEILMAVSDGYIYDCIDEYTKTYPGIKITDREIEKRDGLEWNILAEEIKDGNGPDIIIVNRRQLTVLKDAGVVLPLDSYIYDDVKESIFEGAYEFGAYGDDHYALPYNANIFAYKTNEKFIEEHSVTLNELMDAFEKEQSRKSEKMRVEAIYYSADASQLLWDLCVRNIDDSEFVDFENGKCSFDSEDFCRFLRFCKENADPSSDMYLSDDERIEQVRSGKAFMIGVAGGLRGYSTMSSKLGDDFISVMPSEKGKEAGIEVYWGAAISSESKNKEIAIDFVNSLISECNQLKYTGDYVRRDVIADNIREDIEIDEYRRAALGLEEGACDVGLWLGDGYVPLDTRSDGTSYADEYITLMDNAVPISSNTEIQDIIMEEAGAFFAGSKDEYEVAKVIQSRVQLYFDEYESVYND